MITGSIVALVTPMDDAGVPDLVAFERLLVGHVEAGTDAVVVVGTTGESATLTSDERASLIRYAVEVLAGACPVIAGTGSASTAQSIDSTRAAMEAGAAACLVVTPYYNKPTQEGLYRHHRAIAEAVPLPQILYNVPGRTGCDMQPETVARLAGVPGIDGIKEATGSLERIRRIRAMTGTEFAIYSGDDPTAREAMLDGANGVVSVTANVAPAAMKRMCDVALAGDTTAAAALDARLAGLHAALFVEPNPIPVKWVLHRMGLIGGTLRLPLTPLSVEHEDTVKAAMEQSEME